jgi:zinc transport system substrate-binding protein
MEMKRITLLLTTLLSLTLLILGGCNGNEEPKLKVMTSTSLMTYIVQQVGGNNVEALNLVPPNQHPGNFDAKPSDIEKLASASLFLLHGWPGEGYADKLITSANNPNLIVVKANVDGNWMIPSVQSTAVDKVLSALSEVDPDNATTYQKSAEKYKQRIQAKEIDIKARLTKADVTKINVIASFWQADFLTWAGFNVVATFGGTQSLTPQVIKDLVDQGKAANVTLIINNLQDGQDAGKAIAEELGAENLNLSSFPGGLDNTETWEKAIDRNVTILLDAIAKIRSTAK